jgi:hypothetical protein
MVVNIVDALIRAESVDQLMTDFVGARRFGGISTRVPFDDARFARHREAAGLWHAESR